MDYNQIPLTLGLITFVLGIVATAYGLYSNAKSNKKKDRAEHSDKEGRMIRIEEAMNDIKTGVAEIRLEQKAQSAQLHEMNNRQTITEEQLKAANQRRDEQIQAVNHRISELSKRIEQLEKE